MPGTIWPVVAYVPIATRNPSIAAHPLYFSAFSLIRSLAVIRNLQKKDNQKISQ